MFRSLPHLRNDHASGPAHQALTQQDYKTPSDGAAGGGHVCRDFGDCQFRLLAISCTALMTLPSDQYPGFVCADLTSTQGQLRVRSRSSSKVVTNWENEGLGLSGNVGYVGRSVVERCYINDCNTPVPCLYIEKSAPSRHWAWMEKKEYGRWYRIALEDVERIILDN